MQPAAKAFSTVEQDAHSGHGCRRAPSDVLQDQPRLLLRDAWEQLDEFRQGDAVLKVLEQSRHGDPAAPEHPGPAEALGIALIQIDADGG